MCHDEDPESPDSIHRIMIMIVNIPIATSNNGEEMR